MEARNMVNKAALGAVFAALALTGCATKVITRDVPHRVAIPVAAPCAFPRPAKSLPLPGHWASLDVRQKAATLGAYAINMTNYAEALDAATAACPEVK